MRNFIRVLVLALVVVQLQGCATAVVGGAATGVAMLHDRRTAPTVLEDQRIEIKALQLLLEHRDLGERSSISITSYNMAVLLTGEAETYDIARRYAELVRKIQQVKMVHNEVVTTPSGTLLERSNDAYITAKVKLGLTSVKMEDFDPTRVKVVTSQGVVYLMGLLKRQEADAVVEQARFVTGVKKVVKLFEYI